MNRLGPITGAVGRGTCSRFRPSWKTEVRALLVLLLAIRPVAAQSLRITSPAEGAIVQPGESLTVTVEAVGAFQLVFVGGSGPIGFGKESLKAPPYKFTVSIPKRIAPGEYWLTAVGSISRDHPVDSPPVRILVERADSPVSMAVYPVAPDLMVGRKAYLSVTGQYADNTTADLSKSGRIRYSSSAPDVASVQAQGIVAAIAPGMATIEIRYDKLSLEVSVRVRANQK